MARRWAKRLVRKFEAMQSSPWLRPFARYITQPELWSLNRRSVALAVAAGMIGGLIPGPFQMLTAGILAIVVRCNFPISLVMTLYSNPLTIVPLYLLAYQLGALVIPGQVGQTLTAPPGFDWLHIWDSTMALAHWAWNLGTPLFVGVPLLALLLAIAGYVITLLGWNLHLRMEWRARKLARKQREAANAQQRNPEGTE
ncbi:MAG: DUF2062 domain-containing protein [Thiomonas sp.]|uniref:DUF2062 domain-containing protein n=1 Tax=Thiomonas sp. TaxID=2047785 RepID=UPI002A35C22E|nr:DUF2062 domain-containing protein [Thiomonas sp.]MDY0330185.1 DUF2062 domain-containing protein [Thiomonas sp.]